MNQTIHIVAFDVPYPPNYGGVIDIFYKIKKLHQVGVKIILHCFDYGRGQQKELENYCQTIHYYKRNLSKRLFFSPLPFIVASRASNELIKNLCTDNFPILFEGLHCCFYLNDSRLKNRKKIVRTHNIEHDYYQQLASVEKKIWKRMYFLNEAKKLKKFENNLASANVLAAISPNDYIHIQNLKFETQKSIYLPAFHGFDNVDISLNTEKFCLFHGNLSVGENNEAAIFLAKKVFNNLSVPLVIAGSNPSKELVELAQNNDNITLKANISTNEINDLIAKAQINILPTHQGTGIKLKLLAALFRGKHCLVNTTMVENTGLEDLCIIANSASEFKKEINRLINTPFREQDIQKREQTLDPFNPQKNIKDLISAIF
ncbi:MAG: glycosyltransferase [Bacteroidetes bacterium]|nr:glycosyltransferase [Bacteroidota bacterium]